MYEVKSPVPEIEIISDGYEREDGPKLYYLDYYH